MSNKTKLHYSDVLSVTDGRAVSINGIDGIYKTCDALAGPGVTTLALMYLAEPLKAHLRKLFPEFANPLVKRGLDEALDRWRAGNPSTESRKQSNSRSMKRYLDTYVLPLLKGKEEYEVEHLSNEEQDALMDGYGPFLEKTLAGKEVIALVVGDGS